MSLIKSISGIRGTIGGKTGESLSPVDIVKFAAAYGQWLKKQSGKEKYQVVIGRDARISGYMVKTLVIQTLTGLGIDTIDLDFATTPTVEIMVTNLKADGGIIITASHNPRQWNALKLLNSKGEFLSDKDGKLMLEIAENEDFNFATVDQLGQNIHNLTAVSEHTNLVKNLKLVDLEAIRNANFKVVIDCVNSVGGIAIPHLLSNLGVTNVIELYTTPNGEFPHNPEPLPEHLTEISRIVQQEKADIGFVVDPDVDRLAIVCEDGTMFGEEYTLVAVADYILKHKKGDTVSNLSSSRALRDITEKHGCKYYSAAVGEVNVVEKMKAINAIIGGEGNGGVIYPDAHYGRDALVGIALFLSHLAKEKMKCSDLRKTYPDYYMSKNKIELTPGIDVDDILAKTAKAFENQEVSTVDGVRIDFDRQWVHLRKSNTEPIIRIYSESTSKENADKLAQDMIDFIRKQI